MELSNSAVKTPDAEQSAKPPPPPPATSNGVLKRHAPLLHHHHAVVVTYKECLKNHAASLGGHAVDGCGEFMPSPASNPADPTSLRCAACGCHRNFHRREPDEAAAAAIAPPPPPALEYRPHHRHHPPPPGSPDDSPSPPPISSSYYPSAPHMLLALSHSHSHPDGGALISPNASSGSRKRFRTKFTQNQKELMLDFAEKIGWKMQKKDEDSINRFCSDAGLERGVLKVWMHNNKNSLAKKPTPANNGGGGGISYAAVASAAAAAAEEDSDSKESVQLQHDNNGILGTNGSSSS